VGSKASFVPGPQLTWDSRGRGEWDPSTRAGGKSAWIGGKAAILRRMTDEAKHPTDGAVIAPLISAQEIQERVREIGSQIRAELGPGEITLLCVLKGSFVFIADLARAIEGPVNVEFLGVASYGLKAKTWCSSRTSSIPVSLSRT
jgi:hypothetical protein